MKKFLATLAVSVTMASATAFAAPISGSINMYGDFQPRVGTTNTQDLSTANNIDFLPAGGATGTFSTGSAMGNLSSFAGQNDTGIIKDLTFNPFSPVSSFYTLTVGGSTLSFDLSSLTIVNQNESFLTMTGMGMMHLTGYDDTVGNWNFSGQSSNGTARNATFSWSAGSSSVATNPVPEPASMALTGLGLLAVGFIRRRKAV